MPAEKSATKTKLLFLSKLFALLGVLLTITLISLWFAAPPSMVTSVLLKEKSAVTSSLTGLQIGERLTEGGISDLYLILEFIGSTATEQHRTEVIEVATLGNGVLFDIPDDLIALTNLQRITVYDEDFFSDDVYDSIDVTLPSPYVGSVYQFEIQHTRPLQNLMVVDLIATVAAFTLSLLFFFRNQAR